MLEEEYTEEKRQLKELDEKLQVQNEVLFSHQGTVVFTQYQKNVLAYSTHAKLYGSWMTCIRFLQL